MNVQDRAVWWRFNLTWFNFTSFHAKHLAGWPLTEWWTAGKHQAVMLSSICLLLFFFKSYKHMLVINRCFYNIGQVISCIEFLFNNFKSVHLGIYIPFTLQWKHMNHMTYFKSITVLSTCLCFTLFSMERFFWDKAWALCVNIEEAWVSQEGRVFSGGDQSRFRGFPFPQRPTIQGSRPRGRVIENWAGREEPGLGLRWENKSSLGHCALKGLHAPKVSALRGLILLQLSDLPVSRDGSAYFSVLL